MVVEKNGNEVDLHALIADAPTAVLATIKKDGRPQLSPVNQFYDRKAGIIYVSIAEGRAKTANLRRDPRASIEAASPDGWAWATAEGTAELTEPATSPDDTVVDQLVAYFRAAAGEHPDWNEYRSVMVAERRVLMKLHVERIYGTKVH
ncbi:PPOX class F420-dependent oxidoreductase [Nocardia jiangxiensis]|uniref:PPOX class F420-dependent oxidoreductase n=1 Tax=Nocardia jiangxiensis TaxID=282685 RepID=A0ABW6S2B4_9NOCA